MTRNCLNIMRKRADWLDTAAGVAPTEKDLIRWSEGLVGADGLLDPKDFLKLRSLKNSVVRTAKDVGDKVVQGVVKPVDNALDRAGEFSRAFPGAQSWADMLVPNKRISLSADKGTNTDIAWGVAQGIIPASFINNKHIIKDRPDALARLALLAKTVKSGKMSAAKAKEVAGQIVMHGNKRWNNMVSAGEAEHQKLLAEQDNQMRDMDTANHLRDIQARERAELVRDRLKQLGFIGGGALGGGLLGAGLAGEGNRLLGGLGGGVLGGGLGYLAHHLNEKYNIV